MCISAAIVGGAALSAFGASKAASAQGDAAAQQAAVARETRDIIREDLKPYYSGGLEAYNALMYLNGLGSQPMVGKTPLEVTQLGRDQVGPLAFGMGRGGFEVGGERFRTREEAEEYARENATGGTPWEWTQSPGYQFRMDEGMRAVDASAAGSGMLRSGATLQALQERGQNIASNEYNNAYNRLAGIASGGQNAAAGMGAASSNYANQAIQAYGNAGNAQAAGAIGMTNALNSGINNYLGYQMFNGLMQ